MEAGVPDLPPGETPYTPRETYLALILFAFTLVSPLFGMVALERDHRGDTIAALLAWLVLGAVAWIIGVILVVSGVRFLPQSRLTRVSVVVSMAVIPAAILVLLAAIKIFL